MTSNTAFKPAGYTSLSPYLVCNGAQRVVDFLVATFDAEPLRRHDRPDGTIMHAEMRVVDTVVMIGEAAESWPAMPMHIHVYVPDVDATFERAVAAGGEVVQRPERKDDPDKRGGVKDPAGNTWWIATQTA